MLSGAPWLGAGGDRSSMGGLVPLLFLASFLAHPIEVAGVFPTGMLEFKSTKGYTYCAAADFGPALPSQKNALELLLVEPADPDKRNGCKLPLVLPPTLPLGIPFALFLARGTCSFESKAAAAQAVGASLLVIYNTEESLYANKTAATPQLDYECGNGQAFLSHVADPLWSPLNDVPACAQDPRCASRRCLVTNTTDPTTGNTEVCCAWDLYMTMGPDPAIETSLATPTIPTVFVTMRDAEAIHAAMLSSASNSGALVSPLVASAKQQQGMGLRVSVYERYRPDYNLASILLWLLGCFTVTYAAWNASWVGSWREKDRASAGREAGLMNGGDEGGEEGDEEEETPVIELSVGHTVGFIVMASSFLILLFYVNLNRVVSVLYALSAGSAVATIVAHPFFRRVLPRHLARASIFQYRRWDIKITVLEFLSTGLGIGLGIWWFVVRASAGYAWILQNIMGVSLCILFLSLVRFPNIKVATILLSLAFLYDIFFVFLSPIFFQESVMIKVATGGAPRADETFCEKYPEDEKCRVRDMLPMLLVLPRINDYAGGFTMLGLGDIILPGLLVAFAARYDRAMGVELFAFHKCGREGRYFRLMVIGYALGLLMANVAVYVMKMGQPALLYLVPATLGLFVSRAFKDGTLGEMWRGPPALQPPRLPHHQGGENREGERLTPGTSEELGFDGIGAGAGAFAMPVEGHVRPGVSVGETAETGAGGVQERSV